VASTDHVALMQERLVAACSRYLPLRILHSPRPLEPLEIRLWWHVRHDDDPGHRWFRELVMRAADEPAIDEPAIDEPVINEPAINDLGITSRAGSWQAPAAR
jgi:hypothetical protein